MLLENYVHGQLASHLCCSVPRGDWRASSGVVKRRTVWTSTRRCRTRKCDLHVCSPGVAAGIVLCPPLLLDCSAIAAAAAV